jgi:DNA-binding SARP family transcriptional activator/ABC-type branched-subunit amino acid transport system substrate-binding protein
VTGVDFRILGPLEAWANGRPLELGAGRQRALLALLLVNANEAVSADRLTDELWGERAPPSAAKVVQNYVSQLRRALPPETILTRGSGYLLRATDTDAGEFERLLEEARRQEPREAVRTLRTALALWRGRAFADVEYEAWAQAEIARLEELRLVALEERIDAELRLGDAARLVPELEALVAEEPLRERPRAQLMLALYRSGRQADALEAYAEARRRLVEELGIEPGPELQDLQRRILAQDPELAPVPHPLARVAGRAPWLIAAGIVLTAAAAVATLVLSRGGSAHTVHVRSNSVAAIDPSSNHIVAFIPIVGGPSRLASNGRSLWIGDDDSGTVSAIDPRSLTITRLVATGGFPSSLAVGDGAVWVVDGKSGVLTKIVPAYGVATKLKVAAANAAYDESREAPDPVSMAAGSGSIWLTDGSPSLTRVDAATSKIIARFDLHQPLDGVALGARSVWAISGPSATLFRLDRRTGRITARIPIVSAPGFDSPYPVAVAVGEGSIWVLNDNTATLTKVDPVERAVSATIPIGVEHAPARLAIGRGAAWVANRDGTVSRIDAATNAVHMVSLGRPVRDVAIAGGHVWVTAGSGLSTIAGASLPARDVHALPASSCSPIYYQGGQQPQYLIVADLPLQGYARALATQAGQAIQFVLRQHQFRAGRYAIGYQACDDSTAGNGFSSAASCAANAHDYANDRSVIGVIGPLDSGCARVEVPIANRAPGGSLALISPTNTYVGLTHAGPGAAPNEPGRYHPTGIRNYVRIIAADDVQAAADAVLAKRLGTQRIYLVRDKLSNGYGVGLADAFTSAARRLGLTIVGVGVWDYAHPRPRLLAAQAHRLRADTVFIAAAPIADPRIGTFIGTLHALAIRVVAPDAFSDFGKLLRFTGAAAEGMMVSVPGLPSERLPKAGKALVAAFGRAVGQTPRQFSVYSAQAAVIMLDAIARSNGTRSSVTKQLFKTRITNGILGGFAFDDNGDTTADAVTIYQIANGVPKTYAVITPPRSLVH